MKRLIVVLLTVALVFSATGASTSTKSVRLVLTPAQVRTLETARRLQVTDQALGNTLQRTVMLLGLQETLMGEYGKNADGVVVGDKHFPFGRRSYGKWQMRLSAAKDTLQRHPEMDRFGSDEGLIGALLYNDQFAANMCALHFSWLYQKSGRNWKRAVLAYNRGLEGSRTGSDPNNYLAGIKDLEVRVLKPFLRGEYAVASHWKPHAQ